MDCSSSWSQKWSKHGRVRKNCWKMISNRWTRCCQAQQRKTGKNSIPSNALQLFLPSRFHSRKPESDQLCFWLICGHFEFFPRIDVFCIIHQNMGGINPAIDGLKWFSCFIELFYRNLKLFLAFWGVFDRNKSITLE